MPEDLPDHNFDMIKRKQTHDPAAPGLMEVLAHVIDCSRLPRDTCQLLVRQLFIEIHREKSDLKAFRKNMEGLLDDRESLNAMDYPKLFPQDPEPDIRTVKLPSKVPRCPRCHSCAASVIDGKATCSTCDWDWLVPLT